MRKTRQVKEKTMGKLVILDAGHGGVDCGAKNGNRYESNDNLRFVLALKSVLEQNGITVILTRDNDKTVSLQERTNLERSMSCDLFLSCHRNSHNTESANGIENWVYQGTDQYTIEFAQLIMDELVKLNIFANRGVKKGNFHVCRETKCPACLLELSFISNENDNVKYDYHFNSLVVAVAKGVLKRLGLTYQETVPDVSHETLYKVQVGAFSKKENAENLKNELIAKGYQAYVIESEV